MKRARDSARPARSLPSRIQEHLARYYGLDQSPAIDDYVRQADGAAREELLIRDDGEGLEVALHLPRLILEGARPASLDILCQVLEGVSHFVYVAERARRELPATHLELELQAEIDKYVLLIHAGSAGSHYSPARAAALCARLFEGVRYADPVGTERGDRYRMANSLAARLVGRLEARFARRGRFDELRAELRRFYRAGQTEKIGLARAA